MSDEDLPDLFPDALTSFELFKVSLKEVGVIKVALYEVRVIGKVPLGEVSVVGFGVLFLAEEEAVF